MRDVELLTINLLNPNTTAVDATPMSAAIQLAAQKFAEQMTKADLVVFSPQEAILDITTQSGAATGAVNGRPSEGRNVIFRVRVLTKTGQEYESGKLIFVAPHNPNIERRSNRTN